MNLSHYSNSALFAPFPAALSAASWPTYSSIAYEAALKSAEKFIKNRIFLITWVLGSFSSESGEIFDEVATAFSKIIAEGSIFEKNRWQDRGKIPDAERDEPKTQVNSEIGS